MTVPMWFLFLAGVCAAVRAVFGLASLIDKLPDDEREEAARLAGRESNERPGYIEIGRRR